MKPKYRCEICENELSPIEKKAKKARVYRKKFRTKHTETFRDFIGKDGRYAMAMKKMKSHKYRVILLGSDHKKKHRENRAKMRETIVTLPRGTQQHQTKNNNLNTSQRTLV